NHDIELDNALVALENRRIIGKCNMRINPGMKPKESTYQVVLDALALTSCYPAFLFTAEVPVIYMHQLWATVTKHKSSYRFKIDNKKFISSTPTMKNLYINHQQMSLWGKKSDSAISSEESPSKKKSAKAKKVTTTKPKPTKKKAPVSTNRCKGLNVLSEVALSKVARLKEATKQSKKDFHISHVSGSGDGTNFESGVPDGQHHKTSGTDEGTKDDDDEDDEGNDANDDSDGNDDDDDGNNGNDGNGDDNDDNFKEEEENIDDEEKIDEEEDDEVTKELYKDVNVNLGNVDADMTNADQGGEDQQNVSQESGFEQVEEDAYVTLTPVLDTQKTNEPVQSSSVSSNFTSKLLNLENSSLAD
ncbi:hypothetical protein Tco_1358060, partial [Tanacetum coccineum]